MWNANPAEVVHVLPSLGIQSVLVEDARSTSGWHLPVGARRQRALHQGLDFVELLGAGHALCTCTCTFRTHRSTHQPARLSQFTGHRVDVCRMCACARARRRAPQVGTRARRRCPPNHRHRWGQQPVEETVAEHHSPALKRTARMVVSEGKQGVRGKAARKRSPVVDRSRTPVPGCLLGTR